MRQTSCYDLTIIVPVYNEEDNLLKLEGMFNAYIPTALFKACVLFVNDGSTDGSQALVSDICGRNPGFYFLQFAQNRGLSAAMKAGIDYAESRFVGYMDADMQTTPEDFNLLLRHVEDYKLVMGIRANRKDSFFKNLQSKIANGFRRSMTGDKALDTGCPLKVMHTEYAKRIPFFNGMHRFLPALVSLQEGGTMMQIPVRHFPRVAGVSKYNLYNRLFGPFKDCFAFRWMKKRYINYKIEDTNLADRSVETSETSGV